MKLKVNHNILILKVLIHLSALLPLLWLYSNAWYDRLGADPVKVVIHFTGIGALNLLCLTLAITPLAQRFKLAYLMQVRRLMGLYSFTYAVLHLANFIAFDLQFDFRLLLSEILKRPYISIGMIAFVIISALAVTSISTLKRKMGRSWHKLHQTIYVLIILVVIHFYWSVKSALIEPSLYGLAALFLLSFRKKKLLARWQKKVGN